MPGQVMTLLTQWQ